MSSVNRYPVFLLGIPFLSRIFLHKALAGKGTTVDLLVLGWDPKNYE